MDDEADTEEESRCKAAELHQLRRQEWHAGVQASFLPMLQYSVIALDFSCIAEPSGTLLMLTALLSVASLLLCEHTVTRVFLL